MRVIIAAAGTGGHINPGIAIANKIKEKDESSEIVFIGTTRGLENDLVPRAGYKLKIIEAYGFNRTISVDNISKILKTLKSKNEMKDFIKEFKPDVVIGTGGYICVPVVLAALKLHIPVVLHESNAFPGKSVKMFAGKANKVLVGFDDTKRRLPQKVNIVTTGTPTKIKSIQLSKKEKDSIIKNIGLNTEKPIVLVFGGSQGAKIINENIIELIAKGKNQKYQILWATGPKQYDNVKVLLSEKGININNIENTKIVPYIYNMEEIMNVADLIICRSGAMTITEISIVGKPAIFIPLATAAENHQEYNARVLEKIGAAKIILEKQLNSEKLEKEINGIIENQIELVEMGNLARTLAPQNVEEKIYNEIIDLLK